MRDTAHPIRNFWGICASPLPNDNYVRPNHVDLALNEVPHECRSNKTRSDGASPAALRSSAKVRCRNLQRPLPEAGRRSKLTTTPCVLLKRDTCHAAGPAPDRARHASRRRSLGGECVECTAARPAAVPRKEKGTATTSTAGTPKRFRQLASGCETPRNYCAALSEGPQKAELFNPA